MLVLCGQSWLVRKVHEKAWFSLRQRMIVSQRLPKDLVPKVIMATRRLKDYPLGSIGNMDETPLWLDMSGATTITHSGERLFQYKQLAMRRIDSPFASQQWLMEED